MENVIVALITGGLSFLGVMFSNMASNRKIEADLQKAQAVTDNQIKNLESKVASLAEDIRNLATFDGRITRLEAALEALKEEIKRFG